MGASEGTMLAAESAARAPEKVKGGLILYAVLSSTLKDMLKYQAADGAFMVINAMFDTNKDGKTSSAEFEAAPAQSRARFQNTPFECAKGLNGMTTREAEISGAIGCHL